MAGWGRKRAGIRDDSHDDVAAVADAGDDGDCRLDDGSHMSLAMAGGKTAGTMLLGDRRGNCAQYWSSSSDGMRRRQQRGRGIRMRRALRSPLQRFDPSLVALCV